MALYSNFAYFHPKKRANSIKKSFSVQDGVLLVRIQYSFTMSIQVQPTNIVLIWDDKDFFSHNFYVH